MPALSFAELTAAAKTKAGAGDYQGAVQLLDEALRDTADERSRASALALQARFYPRLGNLQASVRCGTEAVALGERHGDDGVLADALSALCFVYAHLLMGRDALECGMRAVAAARRLPDPIREAWALNRVGVAYASLDNTRQGAESLNQALGIAREQAAEELTFACLNNLAHVWLYRTKELRRSSDAQQREEAEQQALLLAAQATAGVRGLGNPFQIATAVSNQVEALLAVDAFDEAAPLLDEFEQLSIKHDYQALVLQAAAHRAMILKARGDLTGAVAGLSTLLECQTEDLEPQMRRILVHALYEAHKALGDYKLALEHLEQHAELERQVKQDTTHLQTEVIQIRQEVEQARSRTESALQFAQREHERASQMEREQKRLRDQAAAADRAAHEDVLTGLHNRRHAEFALPLLVQGARLSGVDISLATLDVDHFKQVNDNYGHAVGDQVLYQLAQLLRHKMRSADLLARVGGEEFLIALVGSSPMEARPVCERLRMAVAEHDWHQIAPGLVVRISIGLAGGMPPEDASELLERSDQALYAAKRGGRDRTHVEEIAAAGAAVEAGR